MEAHASGDANSVAELAQAQLDSHGEDGQKPSFNHYLGWARFQRGDLGGARDAFLAAVEHDPHDARSWLHLGASLLSAFQIPAATAAFANANDAAIKTGDGATARDALAKLGQSQGLGRGLGRLRLRRRGRRAGRFFHGRTWRGSCCCEVKPDVLRELARHQPHASSIEGAPSSPSREETRQAARRVRDVGLRSPSVSATLRAVLLALDDHCEVWLFPG